MKIQNDNFYFAFIEKETLFFVKTKNFPFEDEDKKIIFQNICFPLFSFDLSEDFALFSFFSENETGNENSCTLKVLKYSLKKEKEEEFYDLKITPFLKEGKIDSFSLVAENFDHPYESALPSFQEDFEPSFLKAFLLDDKIFLLLQEDEIEKDFSNELLLLFQKEKEWFFRVYHFVDFFEAKKKDKKIYLFFYDAMMIQPSESPPDKNPPQKEHAFFLVEIPSFKKEKIHSLKEKYTYFHPPFLDFNFKENDEIIFALNFWKRQKEDIFYFSLFNKEEEKEIFTYQKESPILLDFFPFDDDFIFFYLKSKKENSPFSCLFKQKTEEILYPSTEIKTFPFEKNSFFLLENTSPPKLYFLEIQND